MGNESRAYQHKEKDPLIAFKGVARKFKAELWRRVKHPWLRYTLHPVTTRRNRSQLFGGKWIFVTWFPDAFVAGSVLILNRAAFEPTTHRREFAHFKEPH